MLQLIITHNGRLHPTPLTISPTATTTTLHQSVLDHLSLPSDTSLRLLTSGKSLAPDETPLSSTPLTNSPSLFILSTAHSTLSTLHSQKPDPLLRPFTRPALPKYIGAPRRTRPAQGDLPSDYGFGRVEALAQFADKDRALAILEELRSDPGFLDVMRRKKWRVGALKEMPPEGKVGIDPVCVLGYNTNNGQEIHLRLRTDDRLGFRSRISMRQVLAHELAHNEISEHNNEFKELMRWIEREASKADWTKRGGRAVVKGYDAGGGEGLDPLEDAIEQGEKIHLNFVGVLGSRDETTGIVEAQEANLDDEGTESERAHRAERTSTDSTEGNRSSQAREEHMLSASPLTSPDRSLPTKGPADTTGVHRAGEISSSKAQRPTGALTDMGFSEGFAILALRENSGNIERAAHWLVTAEYRSENSWETSEGMEDRVLMENVRGTVGALLRAGLGREKLVSALDALHLYLSNVLRNPGVERYERINANNEGFRRRVGEWAQAVEILVVAGFRLTDGMWKYSSRDNGRLWLTKSVVQEVLVKELSR